MKEIVKGLVVAGAIMGTGAASAFCFDDMCWYGGADYVWTSTSGRHGHHSNGFHHGRGFGKSYNGGDLYIGGRWCDLGVELGYDFTQRKRSTHRHTLTSTQLATLVGTDAATAYFAAGGTGDTRFRTKTRFNGWHLDLNGYMNICECLEGIGSIGVGFVKPHASHAIAINGGNGSATLPGFTRRGNFLIERGHARGSYKAVFRLGAGAQYAVTECVFVRGMVRWQNLNNLRVRVRRGVNTFATHHHVKPRDAWSLSLGAGVKF
jgi:opacity protein-like surface antigen